MDIKCKTCDIWTWKRHLFLSISSTNIDTLVPLLYPCVETRSIEVFWLSQSQQGNLVRRHLQLSNVLERISWPNCEQLYLSNTSHHKQETFIYEYPLHWVLCSQRTHNRTILFGSTHLKHSCHFDYWNQPLNMYVCYLDCHEGVLCCYLVIHIGNLLCPLQLFYFHLWPIYWLTLIYKCRPDDYLWVPTGLRNVDEFLSMW
jgi:hypothetical protein